MTRFFAALPLVLAALLCADPAGACPGGVLKIHDVTLGSDGVITRSATVKRQSDAQRPENIERYVSVVRDFLKIERGDEIVLNAGLQFVDASFFVKVKLEAQDRDAQGVFSTTYQVVETMISSLSGVEQRSQKAYLAKIVGNYAGKGIYTRGCGEVIKTDLDPKTPVADPAAAAAPGSK